MTPSVDNPGLNQRRVLPSPPSSSSLESLLATASYLSNLLEITHVQAVRILEAALASPDVLKPLIVLVEEAEGRVMTAKDPLMLFVSLSQAGQASRLPWYRVVELNKDDMVGPTEAYRSEKRGGSSASGEFEDLTGEDTDVGSSEWMTRRLIEIQEQDPGRTLMQQGGCEDTGFLGRIFVAFVWRILVTVIRVCEWPVRILFPQSFKGLHIGPNAATDMSCLPKTTYTTHACIAISNASAADAFSFLTHSEQNWKYSKRLINVAVAPESPVKYGLGTIYDIHCYSMAGAIPAATGTYTSHQQLATTAFSEENKTITQTTMGALFMSCYFEVSVEAKGDNSCVAMWTVGTQFNDTLLWSVIEVCFGTAYIQRSLDSITDANLREILGAFNDGLHLDIEGLVSGAKTVAGR